MKLKITPILNGKTQSLSFDYPIEVAGDAREYFPADIEPASPINVNVVVTDRGEYVSVCVETSLEYTAPCARCLAPANGTASTKFERIVAAHGSFSNEDDYDDEDILTVTEGEIDVDRDVLEETALAMPDILLCREDCAGLCPKCGKRRDGGECKCGETREIDPRMKIFEKLLDQMK